MDKVYYIEKLYLDPDGWLRSDVYEYKYYTDYDTAFRKCVEHNSELYNKMDKYDREFIFEDLGCKDVVSITKALEDPNICASEETHGFTFVCSLEKGV